MIISLISVSGFELISFFWILELGDVGVVLVDVLDDILSELNIVWSIGQALRLRERHVFDGSHLQELSKILLLHIEILHWLLRAQSVCRNLVERSPHQPADHSLLVIVHDITFSEFVGVGPDVLEANKLGDQHIVDALDVLRDFQIDKCGVGVLLDVDGPKEYGLKLGLKNLCRLFSL